MAKCLTIAFMAAIVPTIVSSTAGDFATELYTKCQAQAEVAADKYERLTKERDSLQSSHPDKTKLDEELNRFFQDLGAKQLFPLNGEFQCHAITMHGTNGQGSFTSDTHKNVYRRQFFTSDAGDAVHYLYADSEDCKPGKVRVSISLQSDELFDFRPRKYKDGLLLEALKDSFQVLSHWRMVQLISIIYYVRARQELYGFVTKDGQVDVDFAKDAEIQGGMTLANINKAMKEAKRKTEIPAAVWSAIRDRVGGSFGHPKWLLWKSPRGLPLRLRNVVAQKSGTGSVRWIDSENSVYTVDLARGGIVSVAKQDYPDNEPAFRLTVKDGERELFEYQFARYGEYGEYLVDALSSKEFLELNDSEKSKILTILFEITMLH